MLVTEIEITQYRYCSERARHMANVCLTLKDRVVSLFCQIELPEGESQAARSRAFIRDAARQLLRMPEFRSGRDTLEFAEDLGGAALLRPG